MPDIAGLKLIVPTSVAASGAGASATLSASGKITFTAIPSTGSLVIENCFPSTYDNFLFVIRHSSTTSTANIYARLRTGGTNATGSNYVHQYLFASGSSAPSGGRATEAQMRIGYSSHENRSGDHVYFYGPRLAQPTAHRDVNVTGLSGATLNDYAGTHSLSTAYESIAIYPDANTISGALTIYGLSQ